MTTGDLANTAEIHRMPVGDLVLHESTADCACRPDVEHVPNGNGPDGWLYTHHSLDGREAHE